MIRKISRDRILELYNKKTFVFLILFLSIPLLSNFGQEEYPLVDSLKVNRSILFEQPPSLQTLDQFHIPVGFYSNFTAYPELVFLELEHSMKNQKQPDFKVLQNELLKNFKQSMQWKENYNIGVFGKYLGAAMGAAAVGLAAISIAKYGKEYFSNKKQKRK